MAEKRKTEGTSRKSDVVSAGSSTEGTAFESSPWFLLCALGNRLSVIAERNLRKNQDLSLMEWRVLAVLAIEPAAAPGRIVSVSGVNKAAVSRAVTSLERRGLIRRKSAPDHGLRTNLFLTREGTRLFASGIGERQLAEQALVHELSPANIAQLMKLLIHLMRNVDRIDTEQAD